MCGGHNEKSGAQMEPEVIEIANSFRGNVEEQHGACPHWEVVSYTQQVVAGIIFHFKVKVDHGNGEHCWIKVFKPLPHTGQPAELQVCQFTSIL